FRPGWFVQVQCAGARSASQIHHGRNDFFGKMLEQYGVTVFSGLYLVAEPNVPTAPVVGITPGENSHIRVDCQVVNVPPPAMENFHLGSDLTERHAAAPH